MRGRGERRLDPEVRPDELRRHSSTRKPAVQRGDLAVCYAAGWQVVFALVEVVGDPENVPGRRRWGWRFALRPLLVVDDLRDAPPVQAAEVLPRSLGRHSYVRLTPGRYAAAADALLRAGARPLVPRPARDMLPQRMDERKRTVAAGYDAVADRFADWRRGIVGLSGAERVERLLARLPARPDVLELGIGAGTEPSRLIADRGRLTGVDISAEQARRAREALPGATILEADVATVELPPASFDAVVALYSLNHLPREELAPLLERVHEWLRPGGLFLATFATGDSPGWRGEWLGTEMFFSGYDVETTLTLVRDSPLELLESDVETIVEPDFGEAHWLWVLARRAD